MKERIVSGVKYGIDRSLAVELKPKVLLQ